MTKTLQVDLSDPILKRVSVEKLEFDPESPRFAGEVAGMSQSEIQDYIYGKPHYASELVDSFLGVCPRIRFFSTFRVVSR